MRQVFNTGAGDAEVCIVECRPLRHGGQVVVPTHHYYSLVNSPPLSAPPVQWWSSSVLPAMPAAKAMQKVSEHTLLLRINRKLAAYDEKMRFCPPNSRYLSNLGRHYVTRGHTVTARHCDITRWALDLGVLKPHEELERAVVFNE